MAVCLGCGEGELKLDLSKIEFVTVYGGIDSISADTGEIIIRPRDIVYAFSMLIIYIVKVKIVIWIRGFLGETQCWKRNFVNFSSIVVQLHFLAIVQKVFQWGGKQREAFYVLKQNISTTLVLGFLHLVQSFKL